ncbi:MAG: hypothetical protein KJ734_13195, partial [Chloroflexi bacterium]|nr:hypothetical protein [Chloroflexota bacterium]
ITMDTVNTGSYDWTTPSFTTTAIQVRVADTANPAIVYATSATFTLYDPSTLDHLIYVPIAVRDAQ